MPYGNFMGGQVQDPSQFGAVTPPGMMPPPGSMPAPGGAPTGLPGASAQGQLDPATMQALQQLVALQSQGGRRNQVQRQQGLADQLRQDANRQLSGPRTGIANVGAAALNGYMAGKQMREAGAMGGVLDEERVKASQGLIDALRSGAKPSVLGI